MSDYKKPQPVMTKGDAEELLKARLADGVDGTLLGQIDSDKNLHVEMHGNDPAAVDHVLRVSELGALTPDGVYHATNNTKPGNMGVIVSQRATTPGDSDQIKHVTAVSLATVHAMDVSLHDELGAAYSEANPMPVTLVGNEGTEVNAPFTSANVAVDATVDFDYTVTALKTLKLSQVMASGSSAMRVDVSAETAVASGIFTRLFTQFSSPIMKNLVFDLKEIVSQVAGAKIRVSVTNQDEAQPFDVFATISGHEI